MQYNARYSGTDLAVVWRHPVQGTQPVFFVNPMKVTIVIIKALPTVKLAITDRRGTAKTVALPLMHTYLLIIKGT